MITIYTYQDYIKVAAQDLSNAVYHAVCNHKASNAYSIATEADAYDRQQNTTIMRYQKVLHTLTGGDVPDTISANNKIVSNFFRRFNTQRVQYSLGNGLTFNVDGIKEKLGAGFDTQLQKLGKAAVAHGVAFGFWNLDHLSVLRLTEFAPLWDESTGALMAGVRFWQIANDKPLHMWLYAIDGVTRFIRKDDGNVTKLDERPKPYVMNVQRSAAVGEEITDGENYSTLPIVPLYGSELKQSMLVGMKSGIDSYDLIRSGFANDLTDCATIYWIVQNAQGMNDMDKARLIEEMRKKHLLSVDGDNVTITPYTQDIPYEARTQYLDRLRTSLYEDYGALDVYSISAGAKTATEITAAYQPLDENADDFEYCVIEFVQGILALLGLSDVPSFKRNKIANVTEEVQAIAASSWWDDETMLRKDPRITPDEVEAILKRQDAENMARFKGGGEDE